MNPNRYWYGTGSCTDTTNTDIGTSRCIVSGSSTDTGTCDRTNICTGLGVGKKTCIGVGMGAGSCTSLGIDVTTGTSIGVGTDIGNYVGTRTRTTRTAIAVPGTQDAPRRNVRSTVNPPRCSARSAG